VIFVGPPDCLINESSDYWTNGLSADGSIGTSDYSYGSHNIPGILLEVVLTTFTHNSYSVIVAVLQILL